MHPHTPTHRSSNRQVGIHKASTRNSWRSARPVRYGMCVCQCLFQLLCESLPPDYHLCICRLQHTATHCNTLQHTAPHIQKHPASGFTIHRFAFMYADISVLQGIAGYCRVLQGIAGCCRVLQGVAVRCIVLQCVSVCCNLLQCVCSAF